MIEIHALEIFYLQSYVFYFNRPIDNNLKSMKHKFSGKDVHLILNFNAVWFRWYTLIDCFIKMTMITYHQPSLFGKLNCLRTSCYLMGGWENDNQYARTMGMEILQGPYKRLCNYDHGSNHLWWTEWVDIVTYEKIYGAIIAQIWC